MPQALPLPDGSFVTIREGETPAQTWSRAQQMYPEAFGSKEPEKIGESGFVPAAKAGLASLKSDVAALAGRTGIMDTAAAEKYIQEQEAYKKKTFKPTEEGWTDAPWTKFKETLGGSLPYMAAPVAAGIGAATLPLSGTAATLAGLGATGLTSAAQFTGSNLSRQMDEGKKLGETDISAAAAASIPQAALDIIGLKMLPGVRGIFAAVGKEVPEKVLLEATKQTTGRIAKDYALATGKAMGTEGLTEAGQQVFERLQAGLNITDANARSEYFDNFVAGAVLGGALAPAGRYVERGQEQKVQEAKRLAEIPKLRAEEEAQIEKERLTKQSPEYAKKVLADYQAGEKQKADLTAQIRKIEKGSPTETADTEFNKSINAELKTLVKTLTPLAQEYNRVQPIIKQLAEKERLDKMSPEEFMLSEVLQNAKEKTPAPTGGRMKGQVYAPEPAVKAAPDPAAANYLAQQIGLARAAGQFDLGTYADYLMQDPKMAARVVAERPDLPEEFGPTSLGPKAFSLSSNDAGNLFAGLKMRLKDREKNIRTETAKAMEQRRQDLLAQNQTPEIENQLADLDEYMAGRLEEGQGYLEPTFEYLNPLFEKALGGNEVIKVNENLKATRTAPFVRKSIQALTAKLEEARKAKDVAFRSGNNNAKEAAEIRYDDVLDALNAYETEPSTGEMTKGLKAGPAETQQNATYAKEVLSAQRARDEALGKIEDVTERLRKGDVLGKEIQPVRDPATGKVTTEAVPAGQGVAASTQQSLVNQAERSRAAYITAVLQEAATHRRALGKGDLSVDEALKAASKMDTVFKDWINRSTAKPEPVEYEEVIVQPAQMRANKVVRPAVTERRAKPQKDINKISRLSEAEVKHFKAQLDTVLKDLEDIQTTVTRETPLLKQQFATTEAKKTAEAKGETAQTLGGELRRRTEFVRGLMSKPPLRPLVKSTRDALNRAADIMDNGKASRGLLDAVEPIATNLAEGRAVLSQDVQALNDAIKLSERTAQEGEAVGEGGAGQGQLFPETRKDLGYLRASPANFANSPKIKPIWEAIAKARELKNKLDSKDAVNKRRQEASVQTLNKIKSAIDVFNKDTAFFTKDMEKWSDEELARVFVGVSDDYLSTEDKTLSSRVAAVSKLLAKAPGAEKRLEELSLQEEKRLNAAHEQIMSKYFTEDERERIRYLGGASDKAVKERKAKVDDAIKVLVAGNRLNDIDNQLLSFMQDTNASVRKAADALKAQIAPWQKAIVQIENTLRNTRTLTKAQRAQVDAAYKVQQTRNKYQEVMHKALAAAKKNIAENTVSGPQIEIITRQLKGAKTRLEKVMADIPKAEQAFATGPMYQSKNLLKFRQMFKQISDLEEDLMLWQETKAEEIESAIAATQAVMDRDVQAQLKRLEMLETQLADMRGEEVTTRTYAGAPAYPFALRRLEVETAAQRKELEASQKEANQFAKDMDVVKAQVQKTARQAAQELDLKLPGIKFTKREGAETSADREAALKNINDTIETLQTEREDTQARLFDEDLTDKQRNKLADTLIENKKKLDLQAKKRTGVLGRVEPIVTKEDRKIEEQRKAAMDAEFAQLESENRQNKRDAQIKLFDDELADLYKEFEEYPGPTEKRALSNIIGDETKPDKDRQLAIAKYMTLNSIESVEAQREVFMEGKPRKKQKPATTQSTAALSAQKPLRLGKITGLLDEDAFVTGSDFRSISGTGKTQVDFDSLFRTSVKEGSGMRADAIKRVVDDITEGWENMPEVVIVDDESGLPEDIYKQAVASNKIGKIPGVYDPNTKIVYLVATNLHTAEDVGLTVAHEVTGHFGLRELLGENYSSTMQRLYKGNSLVKERTDANMAKDSKLSQDVAVEEVLADMAETGPYANTQIANALRRLFFAIKRALYDFLDIASVSDSEVKQLVANARKFVKTGGTAKPTENIDKSGALFRTESRYTNPEMEKNSGFVNTVIARDKSWWDKLKANLTGINFETQLVDRFAGFERLAKYMEPLKGTQMLMYLRQYDQRMSLVSDAVANGAPIMAEKIRKDGRKEVIIETAESANIVNVVKILKDAKQYIGNGEAVSDQFTLYLAALRTDRVGVDALNFGKDVTQEKLNAARRVIENKKPLFDIFEAARKEYNAYNRNLIRFVQNTGAISKELADRLASTNDYIPFYRERGGVAELVIGGENPVRIGSIAEQPYLHGLLGGEDAILNFMTSSVQNTNMLIDMGMRNLATKNAVFELVDLKAAKFIKKGEGSDVVKFKVDGEDRYAVIATEKVTIGGKVFETGVPADILVKGMEGIPTQMPALFRAMAVPSQLLRKAVVLSPLYMARQLFRDSLAAPILSGADFAPVIGALRQIGNPAKRTLEKRGITGGQVFTGSAEDISKILRDITEGKPGWMQALGKFEAMGMEADALTRRAQYNSYIEQGLSEMEATLMALESMNFNKRGASPSVHVANSLIPFFNAQIQGLNVMYKAMTGKLPFSDKLKIQEKMLTRGAMMAGASLLYAAMMEDDEAYKNATPDQKYGNWFVRIPGFDEPVRVPIPFEIGYIFKALPEALYNSMTSKHGGEEAVEALKTILRQSIPGGSSYFIPQAMKPAIEAGLGKSFYTGRDTLSAREKELLPEEQFRANTSELSKALGKTLGISPVVFEQVVNGYTGTLGLAFLHAVSIGVPTKETPEQAVKRLSEYPIVGGAFQPNDAGGIVNAVYERMNEDLKVKHTVDKLFAEGRASDAQALLQRRGNEYLESELANVFKSNMNMLTQAQRAIEASTMTGEEKRKQLDNIKKMRIGLANTTREMSDKTIHLTGFP